MQKAACPQCGAEISFVSQASVYAVCPYCSSMVYKQDFDVRLLGKMAALQQDPTVFQLGAAGRWKGRGFSLIGRVRLHWKDGAWNEWYVALSDGSFAWFAEAQGFLMFSVEVAPRQTPPPADQLKIGDSIELGNTVYQTQDAREVTCRYSEGELPFMAREGDRYLSVDLLGRSQKEFGSLSYDETGVRAYVGEYVEFEELNFTGLKEIDGW